MVSVQAVAAREEAARKEAEEKATAAAMRVFVCVPVCVWVGVRALVCVSVCVGGGERSNVRLSIGRDCSVRAACWLLLCCPLSLSARACPNCVGEECVCVCALNFV